jgi:hypothetical protein
VPIESTGKRRVAPPDSNTGPPPDSNANRFSLWITPHYSPGTNRNDLAQLHGRLNADVMVRQAIAISEREQAAQHLTAAREAREQESELEET